jgi:hypothetical protein
MAIDFACQCGKHLRAMDGSAGKTLVCPGCHASVVVPSGDLDRLEIVGDRKRLSRILLAAFGLGSLAFIAFLVGRSWVAFGPDPVRVAEDRARKDSEDLEALRRSLRPWPILRASTVAKVSTGAAGAAGLVASSG